MSNKKTGNHEFSKDSKKLVNGEDLIYLVPHTHYDAVWVFTKEDYFYININLILKKVVEMLEIAEDYKFILEQVYLLQELEKRYPDLFKKLKDYIGERVEIVDGEYLMADTMLPQGETLIREIMLGKKFVKKKFGIDVKVMWQADSFGLNAQLPQIYRKSGYKYLAFRRGCPEKKPSEFMWEGLNGTRILTHFMPLGYRAGLNLDKLEDSYRELKEVATTNHILMPSGSGVTMPQERIIKAIDDWNKRHKSKMKIATPSEFFKAIEKHSKNLLTRRGEMFSGKFSEVFPDVASTRIWLKKGLRKYENKLLSFEKFATIASLMNTYCPDDPRECWNKVLFLAFHDVIPGTGMDEVYEEVKQQIGFLDVWLSHSMPCILDSIVEYDADEEDFGDVVAFNPLSWDVSNWIEVDLKLDKGQIYKIEGLKSGDEEIEVETIRFSRFEDESLKTAKIGFVANIPATGYKVYKILRRKPKNKKDPFIRIEGNTIENKFFKVTFSPDTGIIELSKNGKRICEGNNLVIEGELGDLYYHKGNIGTPIKTEGGEGLEKGSFKIKNFWIDKSPLRRVINIETDYFSLRWPYRMIEKLEPMIWRHRSIGVKKKVIVYKDIPRIDFVTIVNNHHPRMRLRVRFDTEIKNSEYICETAFGAITRKTDQYYVEGEGWKEKPTGVFPSLNWIDYYDEEKGLTVINKGIPENEVRDGDIYITLLRCVSLLSADGKAGPVIPVPEAREHRTYVFEYSIYPHEGKWDDAKSYKHGYEFNYELSALQLPRTKKYRIKRSFLRIDPDNVLVSAIKKAEDEDGIIIRFYETSGEKTEATLTLFEEPKDVQIVNLMEEKDEEFDKEIEVYGNKIKTNLNPFEIVTLKMKLNLK